MRPLILHVSALTDAEYALYTASLSDLATDAADAAALPYTSHSRNDDARYERTLVGVREARAWLRGRYSDLPAPDIDAILRFFCPSLLPSDTITGGQFFAALRLVLHAKSGKAIDRALAFVQPSTGPPRPLTALRSRSPPRRPVQVPPSHPDRQKPPPPTTTPESNPFTHRPVEHPPPPLPPPDPEPAPVPPQQRLSSKVSRNPFVVRDKPDVADKTPPDHAPGRGRLPPLPPRKPAPRRPSEPALPISSTSGPPLIPLKPTHVTSPLMRQSLEASKHAQSIKRVEEQLDRERVLQVLKTTSSSSSVGDASPPRTRSLSPSKLSGSGSEESEDATCVPPSTSSSVWSLDQVASATLPNPAPAPYRPPLPSRDVSALGAAVHGPIPPPRHPQRRPSTSTEPNVNDSRSSSSSSSRVVRSKSVTASAPPPLPRRKRPESMQLTPTADVGLSFVPNPPHARTASFQGLVRHPSLSRDKEREDSSTMSHIQRTLTNLQLRAQPRLDAVRYKAEAGISKRGYVHAPLGHRWRDEGEQGLMADARWTAANVDRGSDSEPTTDSEPSAVEGRKAARRDFLTESDNLKWPMGEGWAPL